MLRGNNMEAVKVISTTTIKAPIHNSPPQIIDLTPWDLQFLDFPHIQRGLLFRNQNHTPINQIHHLQHSLSSTLPFFPPLTGTLVILQHPHNMVSSHILCNNAGALFLHAVAPNTTVAHILHSKYVPPILQSFFPLAGLHNYEGTSQPLLAVQVTELVDGIFIAVKVNHVVADGKAAWHFINSWAEISRGSLQISRLPSFQRYFPDGTDRPILFPFAKKENKAAPHLKSEPIHCRVFHFTKEKLAELKTKVNADANTDKVSSLQALSTLLWQTVTRCRRVDQQEDVHILVMIGVGPRMVPPLAEDYFGNQAIVGNVTMKAEELLECGLGKGALEINKMIALHSHEKVKNDWESWVRTPTLLRKQEAEDTNIYLAIASSPRFNIYGNDFGWGKPVAVRSGESCTQKGFTIVCAGAEEGSIDMELCLPYELLKAIENDPAFMNFSSN